LGLPVESLFLAAGSDGVIRSVFEAFISPGDLVIHPAPTFAMYPVYARMYGAKTHALEYRPSPTGPVLLLETVVSAIANDHPKLVCLPNPDSPTGSVFDPTSLRRIVEAAGEAGALILIDEAYHPFYEETALPWTKAFGHLVVARTFAKAWGLAGLRIGYAAAAPEVANLLHKVRPMYEVNTVAVVAMERILDHEDAMRSSVRRLNEGRDYFIAEMETLGFRTVHCKGNFLHVAFGEMASSIHAALKDTVLYRQNASEPCLKGFTRFSATTTTLFRPIVSVISRIVARENGHTPGGH
jgi:histidinol-phosphate aminotransferase